MNKLSITIVIVNLVIGSCNVNSQDMASGVYDMGFVAINSDKLMTGYISDGIGDEEFGSPVRTCLLYFQGRMSTESDTSYIFIQDAYRMHEDASASRMN